MRRSLKKILPAAGILATLGLFVVIAVLQSRLIAELTSADLQRRRLALQEGLRAARLDLNREITGTYALLQLDDSPPRDTWARKLAENYAFWKRRTKFPKLVSAIYIADTGGKGEPPRLSLFDPETQRDQPTQWPDRLQDLRLRLQAPFPGVIVFGLRTFTGVVSPSSPILLFPIDYGPQRFPGVRNWEIIELDRQCLVTAVLPEILRRHIEHADQFDFQITTNEPAGALIFASKTGERSAGASASTTDASISVLEMGNDFFPHGVSGNVMRHTMLFRENVNQPGHMPDGVGDGGLWRLQLRHRLGSLDAAVARMQRGNLLMSLAMIALVILDLAALAVLARRIHRLSDSKAEFAAAVSHELRTPLAAICSAADNLAAGVAQDPQRVQQYGAAILEQGKQLTSMVEQILAFASGQAAKKQPESEPLDVAEAVRQAVASVSNPARAAGVEIDIALAPNLPDVRGDASALEQALVNLLTNAIKYGGTGRCVRVSANKNESGELEIAVEDKGPGIPDSDLKHIFEPFYRGFNAASLRIHGTGLGLTIVDRIARDHGGRVSVASTPGQGSCFTLHFPGI